MTPVDVLVDILEEKFPSLDPTALAIYLGVEKWYINSLLNKTYITIEPLLAERLQSLGIGSYQFWMTRNIQYLEEHKKPKPSELLLKYRKASGLGSSGAVE